MSLLKIYPYGSPILRKKTEKVGKLPPDFGKLLDDMYDTMYNGEGIGLSANQVGLDMSFFIVDFSLHDEKMGKMVFINPVILESAGESVMEEGCLSIPDIHEEAPRADKIKVQYEDTGRIVHIEEFTGYYARVIQHETDHLNGIYFVDRISRLKHSFIASKLKRIAAVAKKSERKKIKSLR